MESKNELKENAIKNCACYYFDGAIRVWVYKYLFY